jgi:hypothetical protein
MGSVGQITRAGEAAPQTRRGGGAGDEPMTVEERLTRLEKSVRRWRLSSLVLAGVVALVAGAVGWDYFGIRGALRARSLQIVNDKGAAIELEASPEGDGIVSILDSMNTPRVLLGNSRKGYGTVELYGGQQKVVSLGGSGSGGQIAIFNNSGKKVIDAQANKTNAGTVTVNDFDGRFVQGISGDHLR